MSELPKLPARREDAHKGDCGRVLVVAGSTGMTGAGVLCSMAALRSGAGLVTWAVPKSLNMIAEIMAVEVITMPVPETNGQSPGVDSREYIIEAAHEVDAVVLGPGLPVAGETGELLRLLVPEIGATLVLDAGALTAVGKDWKLIRSRKKPTIITPHPGEFSRLIGKSVEQVQENRESFAKKYAQQSGAVVLLKGKNSIITDGKETYINQTGNPGMATAGSGDVLAGIIAALAAQGLTALEAARLGAHLHGLAGDFAAETMGEHSLIASDILESLPDAFLSHAAQE
jgi:NAD(P)H-hydrate epimerase